MGATEQGFYEIARGRGIRLERQLTVAGLSSAGHKDVTLARLASPTVLNQLAEIFGKLGGDPVLLAAKRPAMLRLDFYSAELGVFIEIDEIQHFSTDRARTLALYGEIGAHWTDEYLRFIEAWSLTADRYRLTKESVDFPRPGGRRAQRAFLDAVRDLASPELGFRILRLPAPECDAALAYARFESRCLALV